MALALLFSRSNLIGNTHFFIMFLLRKVLSFCVAGDWISSEGETYFCALRFVSSASCSADSAHLLLVLHARLKHLAVVLEALGRLLRFRRCRRLDLRIDIAAAEDVG